jgi:apolipoprotein N-acyltransferase
MVLLRPAGPTVQVAVLTTNVNVEPLPEVDTPQDSRMMAGTQTDADRREIKQRMQNVNTDLLARAHAEAQHGAKIVTWTEYNAHVFGADEAAFLNQAQQLAQEEHIYLVFPLLVLEPGVACRPTPRQPEVNKSVMITPEGRIAYQYVKHNLLIGPESERAVRGDGQMYSIATPYGTLTLYTTLGDFFPQLCVLVFVGLILYAIVRRH